MTIKDIATLSGYSVSTVSRVLNESPEVSPKARKQILQVVEEQGFIPNKHARQLKQRFGHQIAVIVKGMNNLLFAGVVEHLQQALKVQNYATSLYFIDEHANEVQQAIQLMREQKPLAFIFLGGNSDYFKADFHHIKVPSVLVSTSGGELGFSNLSSAYTNDVGGGAKGVTYLLEQGHRQIGIIGGDLTQSVVSQLRFAGCLQVFHQHGLIFEKERHYVASRFSFEGGYKAVQDLLEKDPNLTALFAMSDVMAIGAMRGLVDKGYRVPNDMSVMGYDGTEYSRYHNPRLATIYQHQELMAKRSVALLKELLDGNNQAIHETIPFDFIKGESVLPYPQKGGAGHAH